MDISIDALAHRLREAPSSFLRPQTHKSIPALKAFISDLLFHLTGELPEYTTLKDFSWRNIPKKGSVTKENYLGIVLLVVWLLYDPAFEHLIDERLPDKDASQDRTKAVTADLTTDLFAFLKGPIVALAGLVEASSFVTDSDRREELIRVCMYTLEVGIVGEETALSSDRRQALDSVERDRLIKEAKIRRDKERKRLKKLEEKLEAERRKKAAESASRYNRE